MEKVRLNNFILWCKGWYKPFNPNMSLYEQAQKALALDGYVCCIEPVNIALLFIDELVEKGIVKPNRMQVWNDEINQNITVYNLDYTNAMLLTIKYFFTFNISDDEIYLEPPTYSRKIFKVGFMPPKHFGNSYKLANLKAKKYFDKKV